MSSHLLNNTFMRSVNIDLDGRDASVHKSDTHKIFYLNEQIRYPKNTHALIAVSSFSMPYTFYMFRTGINNTFDIETYDGVTTNTETITIPIGNYTIDELISQLNTLLTSAKVNLGLSTLNCIADYNTNKITFTALPLMNTVTFKNITCWKELGFESSSDKVYTSLSSLQLPYIFNLAGDANIYIRLSGLGIQNLNSKNNMAGIVCCVQNTFMPLEYIYYRANELSFFKTNDLLNNIEVQILDSEFNDIGTLNTGISFSLTLTIHFSYNRRVQLDEDDIFFKNLLVEKNNLEKDEKNEDKKK